MNNPLAMMAQIQNLQKMMQGRNPDQMYNYLIKTNPQFAQFVETNKGKTPEQIANENGIDFATLKQLLR